MNLLSLLNEHNDNIIPNISSSTTATIIQQSEVDTRRHLQQIYHERKRKINSNPQALPSLIPRFHLAASSNGEYAARLRDVTNERFVNYKMKHLLNSDELEQLIVLMRENLSPPFENDKKQARPELPYDPMRVEPVPTPVYEGLNYDAFQRVGACFPPKAQALFSPSTFLQFRRDKHGRLSISEFYEYVCRQRDLSEERINLSLFDPTGDGYLSERQLENYFYDFIQHIPSLMALQDDFTHFYVFTAVRRFFFFLDRQGKRKLNIKQILLSPVFRELQDLRQSEWDEELPRCQENWFSAHSSLRVYREYLELDQDQNGKIRTMQAFQNDSNTGHAMLTNPTFCPFVVLCSLFFVLCWCVSCTGMLSINELKHYNNGCLTPLFISRIFQEYRTYKNDDPPFLYEMDYKQFLDFTLAMENQKTPQSLTWFWKILDIDKLGYIDINVIKIFFSEVLNSIVTDHKQSVEVNCLDVCDEIFDMVKPVDPCRITLKDLISCGVGDTIVSMLIDVTEFLSLEQEA
jgi:serine/threonine-protein phosphatase 2A regulatory subunit B''